MIRVEQQPLVAVHLYGILAERYGAEHHFAIRTPREAVRALDANFPTFQADFLKYERYYIVADGDGRDGDAAADLTFSRELHLVPKVEGHAFALAPALVSLFGISTLAATIISTVLVVGVMFGLSMLLRPKQPEEKTTQEKKDESFAFTGPENVTDQGAAVPLIYGRVFAGSVVISAGLSVSDVAIT